MVGRRVSTALAGKRWVGLQDHLWGMISTPEAYLRGGKIGKWEKRSLEEAFPQRGGDVRLENPFLGCTHWEVQEGASAGRGGRGG